MYGKFNNYSIHVIVEMIVEVLSYFVNNNFNVDYLDTITFDIDEVIKYHSQANPNKDTRDVLKQYKPEKNTI